MGLDRLDGCPKGVTVCCDSISAPLSSSGCFSVTCYYQFNNAPKFIPPLECTVHKSSPPVVEDHLPVQTEQDSRRVFRREGSEGQGREGVRNLENPSRAYPDWAGIAPQGTDGKQL